MITWEGLTEICPRRFLGVDDIHFAAVGRHAALLFLFLPEQQHFLLPAGEGLVAFLLKLLIQVFHVFPCPELGTLPSRSQNSRNFVFSL